MSLNLLPSPSLSVSLSLWSHPLSPCRCIFDADMLMHLASTWLPLLAAPQNMLHFLCREYPVRFQFGWLHTHQIRQCCKRKSKSSWEIEWHLYGVCPSRPPSRLSLLCLDCCIDSFELGDAKEIHKLLLSPKRPAKCAGKLQKSVEDIERWMRM